MTSEALWAGTGVAVLAAGIAGLEMAARKAFRRRHQEPFRPRPAIEYPYSDFIEPVDSPLTFRFKPGFTHPRIHINRLGLRGKDPDPARPKTLLLLGESEIFGAKLPHDNELWSAQLQRRLDVLNPDIWSVINGGIPGYNTHQFGLLWDRLADEIPIDVLLLRIGINDISQAYAMGDNWHPDAPWPIEFIRLLERRQPTSAHWLWWSCVWQTLRRARDDQAKARAFKSGEGVFQWEACRDLLRERIGRIVKDAQQRGIRVALLPPAPVFGPPPWDEHEGRRLGALQSNWQTAMAGWGPAVLELQTLMRSLWAEAMGVPVIDLATPILAHPERIGLYLDLLHWSSDGHHLVATLLEQDLLDLGWL